MNMCSTLHLSLFIYLASQVHEAENATLQHAYSISHGSLLGLPCRIFVVIMNSDDHDLPSHECRRAWWRGRENFASCAPASSAGVLPPRAGPWLDFVEG